MPFEEIVLSSSTPDAQVEQPPVDLVSTAALGQFCRLRLCRSVFELFNRRYLSVNIEYAFGNSRKFDLDIGILDPTPRRSLKISWGYLGLFLILAVCAISTALNVNTRSEHGWTAFLALSAILSLILAVYHSHDRLVFYSRNGRIPLLILFNRSPDRKTFSDFTNHLVQYIHKANDTLLNRNESLNAELQEHRRLMEEGVISTKRYELAKLRILKQHR
jgi:hypothetical protein